MSKLSTHITCDISTKPYLNDDELALLLGYGSVDIFREWRDKKGLKHIKPGRRILYRRSDVDKFIHQFDVNPL